MMKTNMLQNVTQGLAFGKILSSDLSNGTLTCDLELKWEKSLEFGITQESYKIISKIKVTFNEST
jgi:hypothetical protein